MRLLITGAGLVGTEVAAAARSEGHEVVLLDAVPDAEYVRFRLAGGAPLERVDVTDLASLTGAVKAHAPDAIVHTAAVFGRKADRAPALATQVNVGGAAAVLEAAIRCEVRRVVLLSSLAVYAWGRLPSGLLVGEDAPTEPATVYGASKRAAELVARTLVRDGGLAVSVLRLAGVYGNGGQYRGGSRVGAMLARVVGDALRTRAATVPAWLGGREYLHAADAARAVLRDLGTPLEQWRLLNIGTGRVHRLGELVLALTEAVPGTRVRVSGTPAAPSPALDHAAATRVIGYHPTVTLIDGLRRLAADLAAIAPSGR